MSATQHENPEGGARNTRLDFAREAAFGDVGADPDWLKYSSSYQNWGWSSDGEIERIDTVGDVDLVEQLKGFEEHTVEITYELVKWFDDGAGNPEDAAYDGMFRNADNLLPNSHTLVKREDRTNIAAENTIEGTIARPTRQFHVGRGALIDEVEISGDPGSAQPVQVSLTYTVQKVRPYQVDQPTDAEAPTLLGVKSSSPDDDSQTVTIEDEDAVTSATYNLAGTALVTDATTFSDIDAIELSGACQGNVEVFVNTGDDQTPTEGDTLAIIYGAEEYDVAVDGDLGIPALGAGTREDPGALGAYERFIGDNLTRSAQPYPHELSSAVVTVANNVELNPRASSFGQALHPGNREITFTATMFGEAVSYEMLDYHLRNTQETQGWEMTGGTINLTEAALTGPGEIAVESDQAVMTVDNEFTCKDLTLA